MNGGCLKKLLDDLDRSERLFQNKMEKIFLKYSCAFEDDIVLDIRTLTHNVPGVVDPVPWDFETHTKHKMSPKKERNGLCNTTFLIEDSSDRQESLDNHPDTTYVLQTKKSSDLCENTFDYGQKLTTTEFDENECKAECTYENLSSFIKLLPVDEDICPADGQNLKTSNFDERKFQRDCTFENTTSFIKLLPEEKDVRPCQADGNRQSLMPYSGSRLGNMTFSVSPLEDDSISLHMRTFISRHNKDCSFEDSRVFPLNALKSNESLLHSRKRAHFDSSDYNLAHFYPDMVKCFRRLWELPWKKRAADSIVQFYKRLVWNECKKMLKKQNNLKPAKERLPFCKPYSRRYCKQPYADRLVTLSSRKTGPASILDHSGFSPKKTDSHVSEVGSFHIKQENRHLCHSDKSWALSLYPLTLSPNHCKSPPNIICTKNIIFDNHQDKVMYGVNTFKNLKSFMKSPQRRQSSEAISVQHSVKHTDSLKSLMKSESTATESSFTSKLDIEKLHSSYTKQAKHFKPLLKAVATLPRGRVFPVQDNTTEHAYYFIPNDNCESTTIEDSLTTQKPIYEVDSFYTKQAKRHMEFLSEASDPSPRKSLLPALPVPFNTTECADYSASKATNRSFTTPMDSSIIKQDKMHTHPLSQVASPVRRSSFSAQPSLLNNAKFADSLLSRRNSDSMAIERSLIHRVDSSYRSPAKSHMSPLSKAASPRKQMQSSSSALPVRRSLINPTDSLESSMDSEAKSTDDSLSSVDNDELDITYTNETKKSMCDTTFTLEKVHIDKTPKKFSTPTRDASSRTAILDQTITYANKTKINGSASPQNKQLLGKLCTPQSSLHSPGKNNLPFKYKMESEFNRFMTDPKEHSGCLLSPKGPIDKKANFSAHVEIKSPKQEFKSFSHRHNRSQCLDTNTNYQNNIKFNKTYSLRSELAKLTDFASRPKSKPLTSFPVLPKAEKFDYLYKKETEGSISQRYTTPSIAKLQSSDMVSSLVNSPGSRRAKRRATHDLSSSVIKRRKSFDETFIRRTKAMHSSTDGGILSVQETRDSLLEQYTCQSRSPYSRMASGGRKIF